ncbi:MAG: D-alanine--D-alanine ligase [Patescibacteria group bacterium]
MKTRVGVMRGGMGSEYYVSLKTGANVLANLPRDQYEPHDILVTRDGEWHIDGRRTTPEKLMQYVDVVLNGLHGEFGEDGKVQKLLEAFNIPYTGSTAVPSAIGMNKELTKKHLENVGIRVPRGTFAHHNEKVNDVIARIKKMIRAPYIVKPVSGGSSMGLTLVQIDNDLIPAIEKALAYGDKVLIEEYVRGREVTLSVIDSMNGQGAYTTPPLEILLPEDTIFDYDQKYTDTAHPVGPARLSREQSRELEEAAFLAHRHLGARHYARYDFILTDEGPCFLEVNTLPGLTSTSLLLKSLKLHGLPFSEFLDHILKLALQKK